MIEYALIFSTFMPMRLEDGLSLSECRQLADGLIAKGERAVCCQYADDPLKQAGATICPANLTPFPFIEGDERLYGEPARRALEEERLQREYGRQGTK